MTGIALKKQHKPTTQQQNRAYTKAIRYSVNSNGTKLEQVGHTHRTSRRSSWPERVWRAKSQSSLLNFYFRLRRFQFSLLFIYFRYGPNSCSLYTKVWHRTYPICDSPFSRWARRGAVQLHSVTKVSPKSSFSCVNGSRI